MVNDFRSDVMRATIKVGDKVHYQPSHYRYANLWENGIVKIIRADIMESIYTGVKTNLRDLKLGWR